VRGAGATWGCHAWVGNGASESGVRRRGTAGALRVHRERCVPDAWRLGAAVCGAERALRAALATGDTVMMRCA
jgi:hypothetical protein